MVCLRVSKDFPENLIKGLFVKRIVAVSVLSIVAPVVAASNGSWNCTANKDGGWDCGSSSGEVKVIVPKESLKSKRTKVSEIVVDKQPKNVKHVKQQTTAGVEVTTLEQHKEIPAEKINKSTGERLSAQTIAVQKPIKKVVNNTVQPEVKSSSSKIGNVEEKAPTKLAVPDAVTDMFGSLKELFSQANKPKVSEPKQVKTQSNINKSQQVALSISHKKNPAKSKEAAAKAKTIQMKAVEVVASAVSGSKCTPLPVPALPVKSAASKDEADTAVESDEVEIKNKTDYHYKGNVKISQYDRWLKSNEAIYNSDNGKIDLIGDVKIREPGLYVEGDQGYALLDTERGELSNVSYWMDNAHAHGEAKSYIRKGPDKTVYKEATYTTCNPDNKSWIASADEIEVNNIEGRAIATNATVKFQGAPVLYSPTLNFAMDERRVSGFLSPTLGSSKLGGSEVAVPYYWNIAPHRDAIITPRVIEKRGLLAKGNLRYLDKNYSGVMDLEFLPSDSVYKKDRSHFRLQHSGDVNPKVKYSVDYAYLSDKDYFTDIGNNLGGSSIDSVNRNVAATYTEKDWSISALVGGYQVVDKDASMPYKRLPEIDLYWSPESKVDRMSHSLNAELVNFEHGDSSKVDGQRLDLNPSISYTMSNEYAYLTPTASLRYTKYNLSNNGSNNSMNRTVPTVGASTGIFFERDTVGGGYLNTLEPKLTYAFTPERNSINFVGDMTSFDSVAVGSSVHNVFGDGYTGADRVSEQNNLTASLTSRLISNRSGEEFLTGTISQGRSFLGGNRRTSDMHINITGHYQDHKASVETQVDAYDTTNDVTNLGYNYKSDAGHLFNAGYRYSRNSQEQYDISGAWALNHAWSIVGRYNYDLYDTGAADNHVLEELIGLKYDTCCWAVRFTRQRYQNGTKTVGGTTQSVYDDAIFVVLELKGLTSMGQRGELEKLLNDSIAGYETQGLARY